MRETTPQVRLIAEPKIRWDAVQSFLESIGGDDWYYRVKGDDFRDGPDASDAELLVEFAGRRCYRSWAPGLNANVTQVRSDSAKYAENILSSKHGAVLEHAQFTFDFHDVSRVFTHELVRHRAGVAISQESLRYVRLTDLGFRIPVVLAEGEMKPFQVDWWCDCAGRIHEAPIGVEVCEVNKPCPRCGKEPPLDARSTSMKDEIISIVERLEEFQRDAAEAFGLDDEGVPFHYKKEVTSALRRLAPIGLSTGMVWSANARTLRHVIAQRTAASAEEEIRMVFGEVARIMTTEFPILFGDFRCNNLGEWEPEWEKV